VFDHPHSHQHQYHHFDGHEESYWRAGGGGMRGSVLRARGRCWLVVGSAGSECVEAALEWDRDGEDRRGGTQGRTEEEEKQELKMKEVLQSEDAEEARDALERAVQFFERAKGTGTSSENHGGGSVGEDEGDVEDVSPLLAEALLTLANLTADENKREELYSRAQKEGGGEGIFDVEEAGSGTHSEADKTRPASAQVGYASWSVGPATMTTVSTQTQTEDGAMDEG